MTTKELIKILKKTRATMTVNEKNCLYDLVCDYGIQTQYCRYIIEEELMLQHGKTLEQLRADKTVNPYIINNTLTLINAIRMGSDPLQAVLHILAQSVDILQFNELIMPDGKFTPLDTAAIIFGPPCNIQLQAFVLDENITEQGKDILLRSIGYYVVMNVNKPMAQDIMQNVESFIAWLLPQYIADGEAHRISTRRLLSRLVDIAVSGGFKSLAPQIMPLYDKGLIDEDICDHVIAYKSLCHGCIPEKKPAYQVADKWF